MKKIILSIKRNRTWNAIKARLQAEKHEAKNVKVNIHDDLSDLSFDEKRSVKYFQKAGEIKLNYIRSSFNLDHFRKVIEARL